nr:immunoglobulin light chain junction region [Macaca mulatta]MOY05557.1 immunoglobulin light chain junction region [Macaca mulatta]MOY08963.1 immunoglobulin light chain junction region [Macaca mulatta]
DYYCQSADSSVDHNYIF